jgi:hypothetical protein
MAKLISALKRGAGLQWSQERLTEVVMRKAHRPEAMHVRILQPCCSGPGSHRSGSHVNLIKIHRILAVVGAASERVRRIFAHGQEEWQLLWQF